MGSTASNFTSRMLEYNDAMNYFAYTLCRDKESSKDLVQETILKALTYEKQYREDTNLKAWLFTIMKNIFINNYRKEKKMRMVFDGSKDLYYLNVAETNKQLDPEKRFEQGEVLHNMNSLESEYQAPLQMFFEGFKYKEIADELGLPIGTIKSRIFLGRKQLASKMEYRMAG